MKKLIFTSIIFLVLFFSRGFAQVSWSPSFVDMVFDLKAVTFTSVNTGFIVGNDNEQYGGTVLKTTNAGLSWDHYYTKSGELNGVSFPTAGTGYSCSWDGMVAKTTNAGNTWQAKQVYSSHLNSIFFIDNNTGFTVGTDGAILKTVNGGSNWTLYNTGLAWILTGVHFANANTGYVCGYHINRGGGSVIFKTVNGGTTWTIKQFSFNKLNKIYFIDANTGFTVGIKPGNAIWKTTNGGQSWNEKHVGFAYEPKDIYFINSYLGIAAGRHGLVLRTNNGGNNWVQDISGTTNDLYGVSMTSDNTNILLCNIKGYIVGLEGIILKNNNVPTLSCGTHKVYICHNGNTLCVDTHAVSAHLEHGDFLGQCGNENQNQYPTNLTINNFKLYANYPNPFNPTTKIKFDLPYDANTKLIIYDVLGVEVARLADCDLPAGQHEYEWNAANYASGVYYYKVETGGFKEIRKMILVK
ncbi:MAG: T9SS C-terminal target domain-containing protein [Ignavibacteriae bacterium]|nr:MAG: T9SS C-terminal target domain-containing protein [Ignavibacteriota bacterium]